MSEKTETSMTISAMLLVLAIIVFGTWMLAKARCKSQATALGLPYTWGPLQGCIVTRTDGVRVDIDNYGRADSK